MKQDEARQIIDMTRGATTQWAVDEDTVSFWMHSLGPLDAETATKAVILGTKTWDRFPAWSSFHEAYRAVRRQQDMGATETRMLEQGKRGYATPEWVWVWQWVRTTRKPRDFRGFPQQDGYTDPFAIMTTEEYESLKAEWLDAGSPKDVKDDVYVMDIA